MFMEAFATGFSLSSGTKPGFTKENEDYRITFTEVICDQTKNMVSRGFENCYNWRDVMEIILDVTEDCDTDNLIEIEALSEDCIRDWLVTFSGWGLLSSILDSKMHRHVLLSLAYTSSHWDPNTGGEFSEEKVFDTVKYVYENMPGKELHTLVPKFGIWFEEIVDGGKEAKRKKQLTLFFNAKWALEVKFIIEKKRNNKNLVDLAAEAVASSILIEEDIKDLPIPETLFQVVRKKFCDVEWIRSYWNSQPQPQSFPTTMKAAQTETEPPVTEEQEENLEEEEFLNAVIDDFTDDVQQIINNHIDGANESNQRRKDYPTGIDGLLIVWVVLFLILALVVYSWC